MEELRPLQAQELCVGDALKIKRCEFLITFVAREWSLCSRECV